MTARDIEIIVSRYFGIRSHIIIPNISWGMHLHECDLLILTKNNYAYEVEIKVSKYDLIKDKLKRHQHINKRIKALWFAVPEELKEVALEHTPERAGILLICKEYNRYFCRVERNPINYKAKKGMVKWTNEEKIHLLELGLMRYWNLRKKEYKPSYIDTNKTI